MMIRYRNLPLFWKLTLPMVLVTTAWFAITSIAIFGMKESQALLRNLYTKDVHIVIQLEKLEEHLVTIDHLLLKHVTSKHAGEMKSYYKAFRKLEEEIHIEFHDLTDIIKTIRPQVAQQLKLVHKVFHNYHAASKIVINLSADFEKEAAFRQLQSVLDVHEKAITIVIKNIAEAQSAIMEAAYERSLELVEWNFYIVSGATILAAILSISFMFVSIKSITRRMRAVVHCAESLSEGNLAARADVGDSKDEISRVGQDLGKMAELISSTVEEIEQTSTALQKSEAGFIKAQYIAKTGSWEHDLITNQLSWSGEMYRIFELDAKSFKLTYETFFDAMHPDDRGLVNSAFMESIKTRQPCNVAHRIQVNNGSIKYVRERVETVYDDKGNPAASSGTVQDITDQQLAKKALQEIAELWKLIEQSRNEIYIFDGENLNFIHVNKGARNNLGYSKQELFGMTPVDLKPEFTQETFSQQIELLRSDAEGLIRFEAVHKRKNGSLYPVDVSLQRLYLKGKPVFVAIILDISERKKVKDKLRQSQSSLNEAQRIAKIGSWEHDLLTDQLSWSEEMYRIYELDAKSFKPSYEAFLAAIHPDDRKLMDSAFKESLKSRQSCDVAHRIQVNDGSIKYVRERVETVYNDKGNPAVSSGTVQDVTEQRTQEEQLRRSQKMQALGTLTGGIAHDFNNLLGAISGYSELLQKHLQEQLANDSILAKYLSQICKAGERGKKLTQKLLAFSRKKTEDSEVVNINALLHDERHLLESALTAKIKLVLEMTDDLWPVWIDKGDMEDAVLNMSINAMHAMPEGGSLTLATSNIYLGVAAVNKMGIDSGDYVSLSLTDTGIGMDQETRCQMFDPFFSTKGNAGTGLGMSQVYGFVLRSGGAITVYSEPGRGTRIVIHIPRCKETEIADSERNVAISAKMLISHETIMVVDDEADLRDMTKDILTSKGYRVLCAEDGDQALEILKVEPVDLLLSDVLMPGMDGYQLVSKVRKLYPGIKIQMVSGFSEEHCINVDNKTLYDQRLQKPFRSETLLWRIRALLDVDQDKSQNAGLRTLPDTKSTVAIEWSDEISTGISEIDADHKVLVKLVNCCRQMVDSNGQIGKIDAVLDKLLVDTARHFQREETIMTACNYPNLKGHQDAHSVLARQIKERIEEYKHETLTMNALLDFVTSWLIDHIKVMDKDIAPFCKGKDRIIKQALKIAGLRDCSEM